MTSAKRNEDAVLLKQFVRAFLLKLKPGPRRTLEEARVAVSLLDGFSPAFLNPSDYVSIVEDEIVEETSP